jgi:hypothetical protein
MLQVANSRGQTISEFVRLSITESLSIAKAKEVQDPIERKLFDLARRIRENG